MMFALVRAAENLSRFACVDCIFLMTFGCFCGAQMMEGLYEGVRDIVDTILGLKFADDVCLS